MIKQFNSKNKEEEVYLTDKIIHQDMNPIKYDNITKIIITNNYQNIQLEKSKKNIQIKGNCQQTQKNQTLKINNLEGMLCLPEQNIDIEITTNKGSVKGTLYHQAKIITDTGNINIRLEEPFYVKTQGNEDETYIYRLKKINNIYQPIDEIATKELNLKTNKGNITVYYMPE